MDPIYVALPTGDGFGGGVLGDNLARALEQLVPTVRICRSSTVPTPGPVLQTVNGDLRPHFSVVSSGLKVGYVIFENDLAAQRVAQSALQGFDKLSVPSRWCQEALHQSGLKRVSVIPHGVDTATFNVTGTPRRSHQDRFVVFSGGKLDFRKSQDVVIRSFRIFAERHPDALLLAAWHNMQPATYRTMAASPYWPFNGPAPGERFTTALQRWVVSTGLDPRTIELVPRLPNVQMPPVYANSDIGLFPNRCEAGTNLVLMEYMSCGKPAICTDFAGHRDILTNDSVLPLKAWRPLLVCDAHRKPIACWCEPDVEEIVETLEWAYNNRGRLNRMGAQAAENMSRMTWNHVARMFLGLLEAAS
jgi:glycosyltransferase involved in cell wall biosynthesis